MRLLTALILFFLIQPQLLWGSQSLLLSKDIEIVAIQKPTYKLNREFGFTYAYLPLDHFTKFEYTGFQFTQFYDESIGWEIINAGLARSNDTKLEERLLGQYGAVPDRTDIIESIVTSNLIYSPIFMKHLFNRSSVENGDISFALGAGTARFEKAKNVALVQVGIINRFIGRAGFNFKFDVRYLQFLNTNVRPNLSLGLVLSYNFSQKDDNSEVSIESEDQ